MTAYALQSARHTNNQNHSHCFYRLVCLSLKDALISGVGGLNLSVEDFQNVAAQLLIQQNVEKATPEESSPTPILGDVMLSVLPGTSQVCIQ
jgi:hypothetical protein